MSSEEDVQAYVDAMRVRASHLCYPELLLPKQLAETSLQWWQRAGTGILSAAVRHAALSAAQRAALSEFRLQQSVLAQLYDAAFVVRHGLTTDPGCDALPDDTIHVIVGMPDGRLLAYFCMQPAVTVALDEELIHSDSVGGAAEPARVSQPVRIGDRRRPLFPTEYELFGPDLLSSLPALRELPVAEVRELSCLLCNQALRSPLTLAAIVEAFQTMARVVMDAANGIRAVISHTDLEARRICARLGLPILYAPFAPVAFERGDDHWSAAANMQGMFLANVTPVADLYRHAAHFQRMDEALELPEPAVRRVLVDLLKHPIVTEPRAFVPEPGATSVFWTNDPFYELPSEVPSTSGVASAVVWREASAS
jgi:hypothetical protein